MMLDDDILVGDWLNDIEVGKDEDQFSWIDDLDNSEEPQYTSFPPLRDNKMPHMPIGGSVDEDFFYSIKLVCYKNIDLQPKTIGQWAEILFSGLKTNEKGHRMSRLKREYTIYFTSEGLFTYDIDKIVKHFSSFFILDDKEATSHNTDSNQMYSEIYDALEKELIESRTTRNVKIYTIVSITEIQNVPKKPLIYGAVIEMQEGEDPRFREGLRIAIKIEKIRYVVEVVEYDYDDGILYFTSSRELDWQPWDRMRVYMDSSFLLEKLRQRITLAEAWKINPLFPIHKFIKGTTKNIASISHKAIPNKICAILDPSQRYAYHAAIDKDITFIWGPPGTGKSFTLARVIRAFYDIPDERTAICCISNVAIDQLVNKLVDVLDGENLQIEPGNIYRAGHTTDPQILETEYLFPDDERTRLLRFKMLRKIERLAIMRENGEPKESFVGLIAEIKDLRKELREHTDYLVKRSRVVFSTVANFVSSSKINACTFDNLIIDEASMLSIPNLLALASNISKRIIIVGDFQQLSPISLVPDPWLKKDVFAYCGIDEQHKTHPGLHMLLNQQRSQKTIVDIINDAFYDSQLIAEKTAADDIINVGPASGAIVARKHIEDGAVRFTKGGTRQNKANAEAVVEILDDYEATSNHEFSIGIITPYVGQTQLIRALVKARHYREDFNKRLRIGTVHTFQGSESDVIIFDIVDCGKRERSDKSSVGRIYGGKDGEHLMNVAVSRAKHKLLVVGDVLYMCNPEGNTITDKTLRIFRKLRMFAEF